MPNEVLESQRRIALLIRGMEYAIANHDFPRARDYSYQERQERENLRLLRKKGPGAQVN
jgi:ATP-dependent Clp protease ATP-binding subunit ClpC